MPNWVTNKITAPEHVIRAMLDADGRVDFNVAAPFKGPNVWDGINCDAEEAAQIACAMHLNAHPLIAQLQAGNRKSYDIRKLRDESFKQFVGMLENYRACGYLHSMDFAREVWGTKWNACEPEAFPEEGRCQFNTAWACPEGALRLLSERFPDDDITVTYADEDIGSNCGTYTLRGGEVVVRDVAPPWSSMSSAQREKWKAFAYGVTGRTPYEDDEDEVDNKETP